MAKSDLEAKLFNPNPEALGQAKRKRMIALGLWAIAIILELVAIFWVLRPPFDELVEAQGFPQWRFYLLFGFIAVIGVLAIVGSLLWKKANRLDPASEKQPVKFFIQNQLGAFIALAAFLPLIVMIFMNKDMSAKQRNFAGGAAVLMGLVATYMGVDFQPLSKEQVAVESQVVKQLVGQDLVWWSAGGGVVHLCKNVSDLNRATTDISSGTIANAFGDGKKGITLELEDELIQCGLPAPENITDITAWVREARGV